MIRNFLRKSLKDYFKNNFLTHLSYLFFGIAIFYVIDQISDNWQKLGTGFPPIKINYFIFYLIFLQIYFLFQVNIWRLVLKSLGTNIKYLYSAYFYFSSNLLAYTPGKIANALGMASLAKRNQISVQNTITTVILFQIYSLISGTFLISIFSTISDIKIINDLNLENIWILFIASILGIIMIYPLFQKYTLNYIKKFTGKKFKNPNNNFQVTISHIIQYGIGWLIYCFSIMYLIKSFTPLTDIQIYPLVVVILIASYLTGLLAFVVPAGFGILEAGLIYGFSSLFETNQVIFIAIVFRLGNIISVLISWLIIKSYLIYKGNKLL